MLSRTRLALSLFVAITATTAACKKTSDEPLTYGEAAQALEEASVSTQASMVVNGAIEISTNFTIGQAVEAAADELATFITSQMPCAEIVLEDNTLTVEYGAQPGNCVYRGHEYSGTHSITVARNDEGDVEVDHEWVELSNGVVSVSGNADVTWSFTEGSRHVAHELTWTRLSDGRTGTGSGDRTQTLLAGGLLEGIEINGARAWSGSSGDWDLAIDGVEVRWMDPVPQAGTYTLVTPFENKKVAMSFVRLDEDTIQVVLETGDKQYEININSI